MAGINKVILVGNLGKDPEIRTLSNGSKVAKFSLATNENYKGKDGNWNERTEWHNITAWRNLAERAENTLTKGTQIYVEGKLRTSSYEKDGSTRYITEVEAEYFTILGNRNQEGGTTQKSTMEKEPVAAGDQGDESDDLPF
ncbi:MAG: single-stranded DNA-binding protein [Luteibaculum sp.]